MTNLLKTKLEKGIGVRKNTENDARHVRCEKSSNVKTERELTIASFKYISATKVLSPYLKFMNQDREDCEGNEGVNEVRGHRRGRVIGNTNQSNRGRGRSSEGEHRNKYHRDRITEKDAHGRTELRLDFGNMKEGRRVSIEPSVGEGITYLVDNNAVQQEELIYTWSSG